MKLVREHINEFQQGQNPYDTMGVGSNRPYKKGEKLQAKYNITYEYASESWQKTTNSGDIHKDEILIVFPMENAPWAYEIDGWGINQDDLNKYFNRV
jgi:hypothetical protein